MVDCKFGIIFNISLYNLAKILIFNLFTVKFNSETGKNLHGTILGEIWI